MYRRLEAETFAPHVTFHDRQDGTATANLREMGGLLQDPPPPLCPTNALANEHFCLDRSFFGT